MVSNFFGSRPLAQLAAFCVCAMMLAWVAPLLGEALLGSHAAWPLASSQIVTDPNDAHTHFGEMLDEPLIFTSISGAMLHRLPSSFVAARPTVWPWSPLPLIHPPSILIFI
jgi:hypothetical protein